MSDKRRAPKIDPTNPAALEAWLHETSALVSEAHELAADAAAPRGNRRFSRTYLRTAMNRRFRDIALALSQLDPAKPAERAP